MVIPITIDILQTKLACQVKVHVQEPNYKLFSQIYLENNQKIKKFWSVLLNTVNLQIDAPLFHKKIYQIGNN